MVRACSCRHITVVVVRVVGVVVRSSPDNLCHIPLQIGAFHPFALRCLLMNLLLLLLLHAAAELLRAAANLLLIHARQLLGRALLH